MSRDNRDETLVLVYQHLKKALSCRGKFAINLVILIHADYIAENFGLTILDLHHSLFLKFLEKNDHLNHDPARSSLPVFTNLKTDWRLKDIKRKLKNRKKHYREESLDQISEYSSDDGNNRLLSFLEKQGIEGIVDPTTPEDLLIAKELHDEMTKYCGPDDVEVMLGNRTRNEEAKRQGIPYATYCKRLNRKKLAFYSYLAENDYL